MLFDRCHRNIKGSVKQQTECFNFRCKIQLTHLVQSHLKRFKNICRFTSNIYSAFFRMTFARQCSIVQLAIVSLSAFLTLLLVVRLYTRATTRHCTSAARMEGRTALVTGGNTGGG